MSNVENYNKFVRLQASIDKEGNFHGLTRQYSFLKKCERILIDKGAIDAEETEPEHPIDMATGWITNNKWYWAAVFGVALLPPAHVGVSAAEYLRDLKND